MKIDISNGNPVYTDIKEGIKLNSANKEILSKIRNGISHRRIWTYGNPISKIIIQDVDLGDTFNQSKEEPLDILIWKDKGLNFHLESSLEDFRKFVNELAIYLENL
ncbi:hypothetical protein SDC9_185026 [bioreactor metagenome]|uniref:Uncharacterized protein n=1 Tax=bioreactor metagenome TaxID=1076179 RepID=A0A645HEN6_9ZZZZ